MLNNLASLLDRNNDFSEEGEDTVTENEERLFDVPIMMLTDINQQVSGETYNNITSSLQAGQSQFLSLAAWLRMLEELGVTRLTSTNFE